MTTTPTLIAVIGPAEPALLSAWAAHYRQLGIQRFLIALHLPPATPSQQCNEVRRTLRDQEIGPALIRGGPWHEDTNLRLRDMLREQAGPGWHLFADSDEIQAYPAPLDTMIAAAEASGTRTVGGLLLDRVTTDGSLTGWSSAGGLDAAYPRGGFVTHHVLGGDPRKIVMAHSSVDVASGQHRAPGHRPRNTPVPVHHFKWRASLREIVERRARHWADGSWTTRSPALLSEARRLLRHLDQHGGRITARPGMPLREVSLREVPSWWDVEATALLSSWRPPRHAHSQSGGMTSSPSSQGGSNLA